MAVKKTQKKATKKVALKSYTGDDMKRYLGSLSEDFQHKVSAIGEQFSSLHDDVRDIKRTVGNHTEMIGKLMLDMNIVKSDVQEIKTDMKQKVDLQQFARLEKRVLAIESREYFGKPRR